MTASSSRRQSKLVLEPRAAPGSERDSWWKVWKKGVCLPLGL